MLVEQFVKAYPVVYHMAERGAWESIQRRGLLSASAVLDLFKVEGNGRVPYESEQRREMVAVLPDASDHIILRDQKPMPSDRLERALVDGATPEQWYRLINGKVFFWAERERLLRLLNARSYRNKEHDVLTVDSKSLIEACLANVWLCHMNSGNTWPVPHRRGIDVFKRIDDFPTRRNGNPVKSVVELVVDYAVPSIGDHVIEVHRMRGSDVLSRIWVRP